MQCLGHTYAKTLFVVYLKFKFRWVSCMEGQLKNQSEQSVYIGEGDSLIF